MAYYHCLLLDVDGTMMDFAAAEHKAFHETMSEFGLPTTDEVEHTYHTINKGLWAALEKGQIKREKLVVRRFEELLAALGATGDAARMNAFYLDRLSEHPDLMPGTLEAVKELSEVATLAVVTNGVEHVQEKRLKESGLGAYMDAVFISERLGVEKPNRRFFETALRSLGIENRDKVLVVGDSLTADVKGGQNAGLDTCWFNWEGKEAPAENGPTHTVRSWEELYAIVMEPDELENVGQTRRKHQFEQGG